jgi:hypothetical protein
MRCVISLRKQIFVSCVLALLSWAAVCDLAGTSASGREPILFEGRIFDPYARHSSESEIRRLQLLPDGLIYRPYLAGPKEPRTGIQFFSTDDGGWSWFSSVGGQIGILRFGTYDTFRPVGIQFDIEGSAQFRSMDAELLDFSSTDVRFGFPVSIGWGGQETKLSLYFLRSKPEGSLFERLVDQSDRVFDRRAIVLGHSIHLAEKLRIYGEVGYAFESELTGNWEFQFGAELAPVLPTGILGAPFAAANVYLLEREDFGGSLTLQAGWGWRGKNARLLRVGLFYSNGTSNHALLDDRNEQLFGFGFWQDL